MSEHAPSSKQGTPEPDPALNFLTTDVSDEDVRSVNASQREVAKFLMTEMRNGLRSVLDFLRAEDKITRDGVTEGMRDTMADVRNWRDLVEENSKLRAQALEFRIAQVENRKLPKSDGLKPARPETFSGDRSTGKEWLRTVLHYMDLRPQDFQTDATRIGWTLSFFKEGRANGFAQEAYDYKESHDNSWKWDTWAEFLAKYKSEFYEQEAETIAFLKLEASDYFQGKRSVSDYCDSFQKLVREAGLTDSRTIVSKFRRGLRQEVDESISDKIGLVLDNPELWFTKAKESELVTKITKAYHDSGTTSGRSFVPYRSTSAQPPARNTTDDRAASGSKPPSTPTPTPAKAQTDRPKYKSRLNCWNCGKEGHPSWLCPDQETERKEKIRVTDLPEEEVRALAELAIDLVEQERQEEETERDF